MLKYLFTKQVHVKPITQDDNSFWGVFEFSPLQSFFDDLIRYGLIVAVENAHIDYLFNRVENRLSYIDDYKDSDGEENNV